MWLVLTGVSTPYRQLKGARRGWLLVYIFGYLEVSGRLGRVKGPMLLPRQNNNDVDSIQTRYHPCTHQLIAHPSNTCRFQCTVDVSGGS